MSDPILASTPAYKQRDPAVAGGPHAVPEATRATACTTGDTVSHKSRLADGGPWAVTPPCCHQRPRGLGVERVFSVTREGWDTWLGKACLGDR